MGQAGTRLAASSTGTSCREGARRVRALAWKESRRKETRRGPMIGITNGLMEGPSGGLLVLSFTQHRDESTYDETKGQQMPES